MALWGGRFSGGPDPLFRELNDSLPFDYQLAREDIEGSIAQARAIHRAGVLTKDELEALLAALDELLREVTADPRAPLAEAGQHEDIHSWVEARLVARVGQLGKKLHTGRSRNDQVATDLRLWTRRAIDERLTELTAARKGLLAFAEQHVDVILPGYTHLQRAQPVLLSHWALAYHEMLLRDEARLRDARTRVNVSPLGSGALAGSAYAIDREQLARDMGFAAASRNSLDAVSDRDFALETLAALSVLAMHLSRLGEDLVLYTSQEFAFFDPDDAFSSGSSLMPQKKNPDAAELLRGKAGRVIGDFTSLVTTLKGLPLAYNKDLQEDKEPLFDAMKHVSLMLRSVPRIFAGLSVRKDVCMRAAQGGYSNATDLADYIVSKGVPFRDAHEQAGKCVRLGLELGQPLEALTLAQLRQHAPVCDQDVYERISITRGLASRNLLGGTGPEAVRTALEAARKL
ncbi:MAG: argininosuccinate lyase [Phycisphaerae bacterium]|jgi:argininosuccinate lyase/amino-acid N-acetyltransferase